MYQFAIPAAMAAMGYMEKKAQREQADRDRQAEAEIARWSPWTGMAPQRVGSGGSNIGGALAGGLQGASFVQSIDAAKAAQAKNAETKDTNTGSSGGETALTSQPAPQQSMSMEDPNVLAQRRYGQYGAPQQSAWPYMMASR